jgi:DNA recombination protein RmuC
MDIVIFFSGFAVAVLLAAVGHLFFSKKQASVNSSLETLLEEKNNSVLGQKSRNKEQSDQLKKSSIREITLEKTISKLEEKILQEQDHHSQQINLLNEAKETLTQQFKVIANEIFEQKGKDFTEKNKGSLETILNPLQNNIAEFKKKVEETYVKEHGERAVLKTELERLVEINQRLGDEAENLTSALKGQSQTQGAWGEMILESLLEHTGLQKGFQFETQMSGTSVSGKRLRPDVVVHLPEGKDLIVDAKVSLTAYERYCSADDEKELAVQLKKHLDSVKSHIRDLGDKNYFDLTNINSLGYVLMFVPIESAISLALREDHDLIKYSLTHNVHIVTPTTLLLAMHTIQDLWRKELQSQNAEEIAKRAGALYDKFVAFVEDIKNIGSKLKQASDAQEAAMGKLTDGKGNIIVRVEGLRKLGAKTTKSLPAELLPVEEPVDISPRLLVNEESSA